MAPLLFKEGNEFSLLKKGVVKVDSSQLAVFRETPSVFSAEKAQKPPRPPRSGGTLKKMGGAFDGGSKRNFHCSSLNQEPRGKPTRYELVNTFKKLRGKPRGIKPSGGIKSCVFILVFCSSDFLSGRTFIFKRISNAYPPKLS